MRNPALWSKESRQQAGPIKSGFGFLTPQADARTAAHELGHGAFNLRHTFSNDNVVNLPEGTTQNLMDYSVGTELWKYQWDYIHNPEGGWFLGEDVGEGASVVETFDIIGQNTGIAPNGKVISSVKSVNNTNRVVFSIARGNYFVSGFSVYDDAGNKIETYKWNGSSYYNGSLSVESSTSVELTYNLASEPVQTCIYRLYGDGCYFQFANVSHLSGSAEVNVQGAVWHAGMLYGASESCFINYVLTRDKEGCLFEDIEAGLTRLMNVLTSTSAEQVEVVVNSVCLSSLKNLSYAQIEKLLLVLASQSTIRERSELAILRLMNAIREVDYPLFFQALERKNNELLIHFVNELHDASLFFLVDETNYTNFIGALSEMYSLNHSLFSDRFPADFEDLLPISVNLTPLKKFEFDIKGYREFGRNVKAHYNEADGTISLTEVQWEKEYEFDPASNESRLISENTYHFPLTPNAPLQPLSPVLLYLNSQPLPLVSSALDGALQLTDNMYIVPAIFLKHKNDKYYNEALRDGIFTTLDVVTIVVGGSTLISGAGKVARIWAAAEVAGAIGNIGSSTVVQYDPQSDFAQCVEAYNAVLALIGVKNLSQGLVKYSRSLKPEIKSAFSSGESIKSLIFGKGEDWIEAVDKLTDLTPAQRNLIVQQEIVMDMLGVRKGVSGAGSLDDLVSWAANNGLSHFTRNELDDILKFVGDNFDFAKRVANSTKEIQTASTLTELAGKLYLPLAPTAKSLTLYEARVWYNWRKAKISELIDKTQTLENQAKQALSLRNEIRTTTRQAMKDNDIAHYLDAKELNMTWEAAINKYGSDYNEIIQASMRGRGWLNDLFKIPD